MVRPIHKLFNPMQTGKYLEKKFQTQVGHKIDPDAPSFGLSLHSRGAAAVCETLDEGLADYIG